MVLGPPEMEDKATVKKILVRGPNWIGDAVLCLPALEGVKRLFPGSSVTLLVKPWVEGVFRCHPSVDRVVVYNEDYGGVRGLLRLSMDLRREGFHMAILFQNAFRAALIAFLAGVPERVGYNRDMRGPLLTHPIEVTPGIGRMHQVYYYYNIVAALGGWDLPGSLRPRIRPPEEVAPFDVPGPFVGMSPGASYGPAKRWIPERFASLGDRLVDMGFKVVIFGGKGDEEVCHAVSTAMKRPSLNLCGRIDLPTFVSTLSRSSLFITNDSGPMHIASALDVPTVAIFGSTDPGLTGPLGERSVVVKKDVECSPCFERECPFGHYRCLEEIGIEEVMDGVRRLLQGSLSR